MCKGAYHEDPGELFAEVVVGIGSQAALDARTINFLIDTGSTGTLINAADAARLGLMFNNDGQPLHGNRPLPRDEDACGVGGAIPVYRLDNVFLTLISHSDSGKERHTENMKSVSVADPRYQYESIIGMDLLRRFRLVIDSGTLTVEFIRIPVKGTNYFVEHADDI
jgi:predicted aspartyl protease